jgi:hypothetical protein
MNDTNFKQSLREKAEKYEMDAPEGLWEDIERRAKGRIFIRRFAKVTAAAAAVALIVGLGIGLSRQTPDDEPLLAEVQPSESIEIQNNGEESLPLLADAGSVDERKGLDAKRPERKMASGMSTEVAESGAKAENGDVAALTDDSGEQTWETEQAQAESEGQNVTSETESARPAVQPERSQLTDTEYYRDAFREDDARRRHRSEGLSLRLLAANSSSLSLNAGRMLDAAYDSPAAALQPANGPSSDAPLDGNLIYSADRIGDILIANLNEAVLIDETHHQPLTFGVRAAYPLTDRLAMESGLNYSILRSDFSYGGTKAYEQRKQTLHYLGIPLNLNYTLIRYRKLDFIVSAGGMVEKCVYGKVTTDYVLDSNKTSGHNTVSVKGLQWSAGASASLQYNFARHFGLFIEPGLRYHFEGSGKSEVRSSYTEEPLRFSLAAGMRIGL